MPDSKLVCNLVSGSFGGALGTIVGQPLDTLKVRLQTQSSGHSVFECFTGIAQREKLSALYRGVTPALASALTENAVVFAANGAIKAVYHAITSEPGAATSANALSLTEHACIGGVAGVFSATAITPLEAIKVRLQTLQASGVATRQIPTPGAVAAQVIKTKGVAGLFAGLTPTILRDVPFNFVFFGMYEASCYAMSTYGNTPPIEKSKLSNIEILTAGGIAGCAGWTVTMPMDVVKSIIQSKCCAGISPASCVKNLVAEHGIAALYRGWSAAMLRAFPTNATVFYGYEMCSRWLADRDLAQGE